MDLLELVAEPRRRRIIQAVWARPHSVGELHALMPEVSMAAVSQHLSKLKGAGLVTARIDGRHRIYSLDRVRFGPLGDALEEMWESQLATLGRLAEAAEQEATHDDT